MIQGGHKGGCIERGGIERSYKWQEGKRVC